MKGISKKWLVLWTLWACRVVRQPTVPVQVSSGLVRGVVSLDGTIHQYLGIPYATEPPRFQKPGPEPHWHGVYDAINENIRCPQSMAKRWLIGQSNCHTLNIYTPSDVTPDDKLAVMVFIHGGGYFQGSGNLILYGPNYLVSKGVILVTINYRINIQGFLCLGIKEAPGNAAMKDQAAALRWVKRNIKNFGGDPDNVTLFGESAGAVSVSYHLYSPMSKGLFHRAITQSGSALAPWAFQYKPVYLASLLAKVMLYESQDANELYKYFMTKTDEELILTRVPRKEGNVITSEILYTPCAEKVFEGEEPFLSDEPYELLLKGEINKVPTMIGTNSEEGLFILGMDNDTTIYKIDFKNSLPKNLEITSEKEKLAIAKEFERLYMRGKVYISKETMLNLSRWIGEPNLNYPSLQETELLLKVTEQPIYNYFFRYNGWRNLIKPTLPYSLGKSEGATHAEELFYIFSQQLYPSFGEIEMIDKVTTMWTNFAKYGNPTPDGSSIQAKWWPTNSTQPTAFVIDSEFTTIPLFYNDRIKYLREVYYKYRRKYRK